MTLSPFFFFNGRSANPHEISAPASRLPDFLKTLFQLRKHRFKPEKQPCFYRNPLTGLRLA